MKLPSEVLKWLNSLPEKDKKRESEIAKKNMKKIENFLKKNK